MIGKRSKFLFNAMWRTVGFARAVQTLVETASSFGKVSIPTQTYQEDLLN